MSAVVNVHEAKTHLSRLVQRAYDGEDVVIAKAGKPMVRLVKVENPTRPRRVPGGWPGAGDISEEDAMSSAMTEADIDAWERKLLDM